MLSVREALSWNGYRLVDEFGAKVGRVEDVYLDSETGQPIWLLVRLGRFADVYTLVPAGEAVAAGGHVWVPYPLSRLLEAAPLAKAGRELTKRLELELELCLHYGLNGLRRTRLSHAWTMSVTAQPALADARASASWS